MKRFKRIVTTTDLSRESFAAVSFAAHLAKAERAKLTVVHVPHSLSLAYTDFVPPIDAMNIDTAIEDAARDKLERWCRAHLAGITKADIVLRGGVTHEVICDVAKQVGASVIVIATNGRKGFSHWMLGSVTERVLRDAPCPVLVVKPPVPRRAATVRKRAA